MNVTLFPGCDSDQYECQNGLCISLGAVCNGINECLDSSDESNCGECSCLFCFLLFLNIYVFIRVSFLFFVILYFYIKKLNLPKDVIIMLSHYLLPLLTVIVTYVVSDGNHDDGFQCPDG